MNIIDKRSTPKSGSADEDGIGVVFRKTLGHYTVHAHGREIDCSL